MSFAETRAPTRLAGRVLIIDDDASIIAQFTDCLQEAGYFVASQQRAADGERMAAAQPFDVCLLDLSIGDDSGMDSLPRLKQLAPGLRIAMVSAHSSVDNALAAIRAGADDYLVKPCSPEQLLITVARQMETRKLTRRIESLEREVKVDKAELDSANPKMRAVIETARQVAATDANILILGPSGTGKGVLAAAVHRWSARKDGDFVTVNCPSLSAELLESEMFGHNRGAFTGASQSTVGRVSQADGGTLFMDEIGDFPLPLQPKLLRFIQDKEYERVGDPVTRRADVRIISATNRDLNAMVNEGRFRQDLLYRLNVIVVTLPALRERIEDIGTLAQNFVERFARAYGRPARGLSPAALESLRNYPWPGNVRELQNVIERAVILCTRDRLEPLDFALNAHETAIVASSPIKDVASPPTAFAEPMVGSTSVTLEQLERRHIEAVVAATGTLDQAARALGIDSSTLYRKRRAYQAADRTNDAVKSVGN